jgi:nucleoside-diphosphate-sugar epimerase
MTRCLVTGGAGFIGSHVTRGALERGYQVRVLDDFSTGHRKNLAEIAAQIDLLEGDIRNPAAVREAVAGCEVIFHLAALGSVPRSVDDPAGTHDVNITGSLNILMAARDAKVRRIVYSASSSAYGDTPTLPKREDMLPQPLSPYAVSKLAVEHYLAAFYNCYGLQSVSLRYFNVFGPRQDPSSTYAAVIPAFVSRMVRGQRPIIFGDGEQSRDFCYIENVVNANLLAAEAKQTQAEAMNIACGERITLNEIVKLLNASLGTRIEPEYRESRPGDVRHSLADLAVAKRVIGYEPKIMFADGLKRAIQWYRTNAT